MHQPLNHTRRDWMLLVAAAAAGSQAPARATAAINDPQLVTAWEAADGYRVGILATKGQALEIRSALEVPTRAHGVWVEKTGTLLAVSRRPGDWLLRWTPGSGTDGKALQWAWSDPDRAFNGHVISSADGKWLYTTETDLETGQGLIGVRRATTLEKTAEWPTHGMDPHELLLDDDGSLVVANGGIPALPETGRIKIHLDRMDASLVRLQPSNGALLGQWRLPDQRLSLRHIAWGPARSAGTKRLLGLALQGEHADAAAKANAPVLATFDGRALRVHEATGGPALSGYGGDIACTSDSFAVSCPRANGVARWRVDGKWLGFTALNEACALATVEVHAAPRQRSGRHGDSSVLWTGGRSSATADDGLGNLQSRLVRDLRIDNHWTPLSG